MNRKLTIVFSALSIFIVSISTLGQGKRQFSNWSAPVRLGPPVNSDYDDAAPVLSGDEKTLYFSSNRPGSVSGSEDIWVATRRNKNANWNTPINLGPTINTSAIERLRTVTPDGGILVFQSDRPGGSGGSDLWVIVRRHKNDESGWSEPINLGSVVNTTFNEIAGNFLFGEAGYQKFSFSSTRTDLGGFGGGDIYESDIMPDGSFGLPVNRAELNSASTETCFWVRDDGLEIIFSSNRPSVTADLTKFDLWTSSRESIYETWSEPQNLGPTINAENSQDVNPSLSADGRTLLFSSRRGAGDMNIYMSTRRPIRADQ